MDKQSNKYTFVIKEGRYKKCIIDWVFANSRKQAIENMKQSLVDAGVYLEIDGVVYKRNFIVKTEKSEA
jgi:hypothetical protein